MVLVIVEIAHSTLNRILIYVFVRKGAIVDLICVQILCLRARADRLAQMPNTKALQRSV